MRETGVVWRIKNECGESVSKPISNQFSGEARLAYSMQGHGCAFCSLARRGSHAPQPWAQRRETLSGLYYARAVGDPRGPPLDLPGLVLYDPRSDAKLHYYP